MQKEKHTTLWQLSDHRMIRQMLVVKAVLEDIWLKILLFNAVYEICNQKDLL